MPIHTGELQYFYDRGKEDGLVWEPTLDYTLEDAERRRAITEWYDHLTKPEKTAYDNGFCDGCNDQTVQYPSRGARAQ